MKVPFLDLKGVNERFKEDFNSIFNEFQQEGFYILGNQLCNFEKEFAAYCNVKHSIGVGNGYDALFLLLRAYIELGKLKLGDEVVVPSNTFVATVLSVKNAGLKPVLVEPNINSHNINVTKVKDAITPKTKMIIATHLYGQLADMDSLRHVANEKNLYLIADAAQAHGAKNKKGYRAGAIADAAIFSFYPSKNLGALGDGGAITTNDNELANCVKQIRNYGSFEKYKHDSFGVNSRLDELQAAFLRKKLLLLDSDNKHRRIIAKKYLEHIDNPSITLPFWDGLENHVFHLFVIQCEERDKLKAFLKEKNVETLIHYPIAIQKQKCFEEDFGLKPLELTEKLSEMVLSLPISPVMNFKEVDYVINAVNQFKIS